MTDKIKIADTGKDLILSVVELEEFESKMRAEGFE